MSNFKEKNYLIFRAVMGVNMIIHGGVRIFGDYQGFISKMVKMFEPTFLPRFMIEFSAHLISPVELLFGALLFLGLQTRASILVLTANMMLLIVGVSLLQKWDLAALQMSYVLYLFFLGNFVELNALSLDQLINRKRTNHE